MNVNPTNGSLLVVEDNPDIWILLKAILPLALPDVKVIHASSTSSALSYIRNDSSSEQGPIQLILQDLYLPERADGLALLSQLKEVDSDYRQIPVVMMSSSTDRNDINDARRLGASSYMIKPLTMNEWHKSLHDLQQYW